MTSKRSAISADLFICINMHLYKKILIKSLTLNEPSSIIRYKFFRRRKKWLTKYS